MTFYGAGVDELLYSKYFPNTHNGFFVECGAADGCLSSVCRFFEEEMGWNGINIEPVLSYYESLVINRPNCRNINMALYNFNGMHSFTNPKKKNNPDILGGWGFIDEEKKHMVVDKDSWVYDTHMVQCTRFSEIFTENRIIDLFVLDVEGSELKALEGILEINPEYYPRIFCIETVQMDKIKELFGNNYTRELDVKETGNVIYKRTY